MMNLGDCWNEEYTKTATPHVVAKKDCDVCGVKAGEVHKYHDEWLWRQDLVDLDDLDPTDPSKVVEY